MDLEKSQKDKLGIFDWTDKTKLKTSQKIVLNYTGDFKILYKENVQKKFAKDGYYLAGPFTEGNDGVAHLMLNDLQYYIYKIYILAKEVIIQHKPVTNGPDVSLRVPIISADPKNKKYTVIDRLLNGIPQVSFQFNTLLEEGSLAAVYSGGTVMYLEKGIEIQTGIPSRNVVNPFEEIGISLFETDYTLVPIHLGNIQKVKREQDVKDDKDIKDVKEGFSNPLFANLKEGMEDDMVEMDDDMECTPYDMGADNIQFMQVPIADDSIIVQSNKNTMFGILYLFYMGVIVMALCFLTPLIVSSVLSSLSKKNSNVMTNFKSMFVLFFLCLFITSIFITLDGSDRHNVEESKAGLIIFFLAFACSAIFVVYATFSGAFMEPDGSKWELGNILEFLFECLPFKKFKKIFTYFIIFLAVFILTISINEKYFHGNFSLSPHTITWGIFSCFALGIFVAYVSGGVNLDQSLKNTAAPAT